MFHLRPQAALLAPDFLLPSLVLGVLSGLMAVDKHVSLERGLFLAALVLLALRPALVAQQRVARGSKQSILTVCVDDYAVTKVDENTSSDVADLPKRFIDG